MNYGKWWGEKLWTMVPAVQITGGFLQSFKEYPPSQASGSLTVSQFLEAISRGASK
jgi:arylsulfatase